MNMGCRSASWRRSCGFPMSSAEFRALEPTHAPIELHHPRFARVLVFWSTLLVLGTQVPATRVRAEENAGPSLGPGAPRAAETRYQSGRALYAAGHYAEAARAFRVAFGAASS